MMLSKRAPRLRSSEPDLAVCYAMHACHPGDACILHCICSNSFERIRSSEKKQTGGGPVPGDEALVVTNGTGDRR